VNTTNSPLTVTSANFSLPETGYLNSGTATTTLLVADAQAIHIGEVGTGFNLSGAALQNITAAELDIGSSASGDITVGNVAALETANIGKLVLNASGAGHTPMFDGTSVFRALSGVADSDSSVGAGASVKVVPS